MHYFMPVRPPALSWALLPLLAACSNTPLSVDEGGAQPAASSSHADIASIVAPLERRIVPAGQSLQVSIATDPDASCLLRSDAETDPENALHLFAGKDGQVSFQLARLPEAVAADHFSLDCQAPNARALSYPIEVTSDGATATPLTTRVAAAQRPGSFRRRALEGDPMRFKQEELHALNFPSRPDPTNNAAGYARWLEIVSRDSTVIEAEGITDPTMQNARNSTAWSGFAASRSSGIFTRALAYWFVPTVTPTPGLSTSSSIWVGLDGRGTADVVQNGTRQDQVMSGQSYAATYYAWAEWFPAREVRMNNFSVSPGDEVLCETWIGDSDRNETASGDFGWFYFDNLTQNTSTFYSIARPDNAPAFTGATAEWIVERPTRNGSKLPLANYGSVSMSAAESNNTSTGFQGYQDEGTVTQLDMVNGSTLLSKAFIDSADRESIWFAWYASQ